MKNLGKTKIRHKLYIIGISLVFLCGLGSSILSFARDINKNTHSDAFLQLKELASQSISAVNIKIDEQLNQLIFLAQAISSSDLDIHSPEIIDILEKLAGKSQIDRIRITKPDGQSFSDKNNMIDISDRPYFKAAMKGESGVSEIMASLYGGARIVTIYTPIIRNNEVIGTVHGACEIETINENLTLKSFGGQGFAILFTKNGEYITDSSGANNLKSNLLEDFAYDYVPNHNEFEKFLSDIKNVKSGEIEFTQNNVKYCGFYMPVGINDWFILQVAPISAITSLSQTTFMSATKLIVRAVLLFVLLLCVILFVVNKSKKEIININKALNLSNELLKVAFKHVSSTVFVYDYKTQMLNFENDNKMFFGLVNKTITLEDFASLDIFFGSAKENILSLFNNVLTSDKNIECEIKLTTQLNDCLWYKITLTSISDDNKKIGKAIGTVENISERVNAQLKFLQEEKYRYAMLVDSRIVYEINVTEDLYRQLDEKNENDGVLEWLPYSNTMKLFAQNKVLDYDREIFLSIANKENLFNAFEENNTELICEYRLLKDGETLEWKSSSTYLMKDPYTGNIMAFTYVSDITEQKIKEQELKIAAEHDNLTKLYNRETGLRIINDILNCSTPNLTHGFLSIDIDDFKGVNDTFGHMQGDAVLCMVAKAFEKSVRENDILVRMGGDEFIVFLNNIKDSEKIEKLAERICTQIDTLVLNDAQQMKISVSIGCALYPIHGTSLNELRKNSDFSLYEAKRLGKNQFKIFSY